MSQKRPPSIDWNLTVDSGKLWIPEEITHLYHTDFYSELNEQEVLAYNQLFALLVAQQFITLEKDALSRIKMDIFERKSLLKAIDPKLVESVDFFDSDEKEHIDMFTRLLDKTNSHRKPLNLMRESWTKNLFLRFVLRSPRFFIFWTWLLIYSEERTVAIGQFYQKSKKPMDSLFTAVHKKHLVDELRHVQLDEHFLKYFWDSSPHWLKKINVQIFLKVLDQIFIGSLSATKTWKILTNEFPRLKIHTSRVEKKLLDLKKSPSYQAQLFSAENVPRFWALMGERPEMLPVQKKLLLLLKG